MDKDYVILLQEIDLHPNSYIRKIVQCFEKPSVVTVVSSDFFRRNTPTPIYDDKCLLLFESLRCFKDSMSSIKLTTMLPLLRVTTPQALKDAMDFCSSKDVTFKAFNNKFTKDDAVKLIRSIAGEDVSKSFIDAIISKTKLSAQRIISAVSVCSYQGYTVKSVEKYVDKYVYVDTFDLLLALLGRCNTKSQRNRAVTFLHNGRYWFRKMKTSLLKDLETLQTIYLDMLNGKLTVTTVDSYESEFSKYKLLRAMDLFYSVSYVDLLYLQELIANSKPIDLAMRLEEV